ncbi:MAG: amino acid adenylation domain-containing protein, partial [Rhodospirillaceae bacterium]
EIAAPPGPACEAEIARIVGETINRPFDLARGPLIRAGVWRIAADDHLLILSLHHILVDGSAIDILSEELAHFYDAFAHGRAAPLPPLPCRFADYVLWERAACEGPAAAAHRAYWTANLAGAPPAVALPGTGHRPPRGAAGARHRHTYPEDLLAGLKRLARIERTTLYPTLLAALNVLLGRYAGQDDVVVGAPVSARSRPELRGMVGMMINVLPIRTDLSGDPSFRTLLARVTRTILGAIAHRDLPVQRVLDAWGVRPADGRPPFTITVVMTSAGTFAQRLPGLDVELAVADDGTTKFDVNFVFYEEDGRLVLAMQYDTGLFDAPTMQRIAGQFGVLLHAIVRRPDDPLSALPMMTEDERRVLLDAWSGADRCRPVADSIVSSFARQVRERPDAAAVVCGERRVSYAALDAWSAAIARRLGAPAGATIAIAARRSPAMIAGLLGILRSGGAYLAIDPDWPADRLRFVLADSGAAVMLAEPGLVDGDPGPPVVALDDIAGAGGPDAPPPPVGPDAIAYVAYTSGSTGKPKGIAVPHAGVVRLVRDTDYAAFGPTERVLQAAPLAFDASTFEIWGAILNGGCLVQVPEEPAGPAEIARAVVGGGATTVWLTAALFNQMVDHHPACFAAVRQVVSGGEAMSVAHARRFRAAAPHCRLVNGYGPTENTTFTAAHTVSPADENAAAVPIGRPIANTRVYVLDPHMQPVAVGAPGELHIGGAGLARGYVGQPDLTAAQFVADPFVPGERLYRSGDRVRWRADGTLDFLGRLDRQVKLAGHRIEPGEIEATLVEHPSVLQAAVVAQGDGDRRRLVAYCVRAPHRGDPSLEDFLRSRLPAYLRPAVVVDVPALPLTANGKLDLDALAAQGTMSHRERRGHVAPRDELEARLATLWADLLGRDRVGVHDDFFDLGGHSLLAAKLFALIDREMEHPLPLATIFDAPTVGALAAVIRVGRRTKAWPTAVPITEAGAHAPLFAVPGVGGNVVGFAELARRLEPAVPLIGLQARGLDGNGAPFTRLEDIAAYNIGEMRARQPAGPYAIFGACIGGVIAYEIAQQLVSAGETVAALVLLDPSFRVPRPASWHLQAGHRLRHAFELPRYLAARAALYAGEMRSQPKAAWPDYLRGKADALGAMLSARRLSTGVRREIHQRRVIEANRTALESYVPRPYPGRIHIFRSADRVHRPLPRRLDWTALAAGAVAVEAVPGRDSGDALREPNVATLAALLRRHLDGLPH